MTPSHMMRRLIPVMSAVFACVAKITCQGRTGITTGNEEVASKALGPSNNLCLNERGVKIGLQIIQ